ncbi:hypothetical protein JTB14_004934 [Gonioctena quinquepunctata]|nr:hypothetical protein JTB14_004934 [Gonioctena quinquepunctata]
MSDKHQIKVSIKDYNSWKKLKMIPSITTPLLNVHDESICLTCKECEEEFTTLPELQEHLKTHVPYLCHVCGLSFRSKGSYKDHSSIHADIKLFLCSVCKKSFSRKSGLWKHQRLHTHPKQYVCEQCGKSFSENGSLTLHKKCVHVRARNFICEFCNLSFPLNSTLQKHIRRRHTVREKAFVCTVCNNTFREKASMLRHYKSKHSNLENIRATNVNVGMVINTV